MQVTPPTPATVRPHLHSDADGNNTPDGTSDDQMGSSDASSSDNDQQNVMDQTLQDRYIVNKGPRVHSSSSQLFPIQCPQMLNNQLSIHPSTHFIRRDQCTEEYLHTLNQRITANEPELERLQREFEFLTHYAGVFRQASARAIQEVCNKRQQNPYEKPILSVWDIDKIKEVCSNDHNEIERTIDELEERVSDLRRSINRDLAERNAARFGMNYMRDHPNDEFVIFVMESGNYLQRTNPYYPSRFSVNRETTTTTTTQSSTIVTESNILGVLRKKTPGRYVPRDKRSNVETNELFTSLPLFKIVKLTFASEMIDYFQVRENVLLVLPSQTKMYLDISQVVDNNLIIVYNLINGYYTSGKYSSELDMLKKAYFDFTHQLERSSISLNDKKDLLNEINETIKLHLTTSMSWYYNTLHAIMDIKIKVFNTQAKMYAIKI
jgi:hypothetical protein